MRHARPKLVGKLAALPQTFVLYGGTAIALHLGHRESVDFDFFGDQPLDADRLLATLPFFAGAQVTQRQPDTLGCTVMRGSPVKLSFFGLPGLPRPQPPLLAPDNGVQVASLLDLAGMKAAVVQKRAEAKDYLDLDALLQDGRVGLPLALAAAQAIYGATFNPQVTLKALCYFEDGNVRGLPQAVRGRLVRAVAAVQLDRLPRLPNRRGDPAP